MPTARMSVSHPTPRAEADRGENRADDRGDRSPLPRAFRSESSSVCTAAMQIALDGPPRPTEHGPRRASDASTAGACETTTPVIASDEGAAMRDGGDGGESNSPSRTRSPGTSYRHFRPTCDFASRAPDRRGASLAIRCASRLFDVAHRSRRRRTSPNDTFAVRGGGTASMLTAV